MEVKVCRGCKKMFQYITGPVLCPNCKLLEEEMFLKVKEYLRENPGSNMYQVTQATEVSAALIEKFLREGRLEVTTDSPMALMCERCGAKIPGGKYCNACKKEISEQLTDAKDSMVAKKQETNNHAAKMRFLQSNKLGH